MPQFQKLPPQEVEMLLRGRGPSQRELIRREYREMLSEFGPGEGGIVTLEEEENKTTVRNRLKSAAEDLGLNLRFLRTAGPHIRFVIQEHSNGNGSHDEEDEE